MAAPKRHGYFGRQRDSLHCYPSICLISRGNAQGAGGRTFDFRQSLIGTPLVREQSMFCLMGAWRERRPPRSKRRALPARHKMIHIIDDDEAVRSALALLLRSCGWKSRTFGSAQAYLEALGREEPDCLLLDLNMPGMDGAELYETLVQRGCRFPVVIVTGQPDSPLVTRLLKAGVRAVLAKPVGIDDLLTIFNALHHTGSPSKPLTPLAAAASLPDAERPAVFVVGADDSMQEAVSGVVTSLGWAPLTFATAAECLDALETRDADLIIGDLRRPEGAALTRLLLQRYCDIPYLGLTEDDHSPLAVRIKVMQSMGASWAVAGAAAGDRLGKAVVRALLSGLRRPPSRLQAPVASLPPLMDPDFRARFAACRTLDLVLTPDLEVAAMTDSYARATMLAANESLGRYMFDLFPDNPDDPGATGVLRLMSSLHRARERLVPDQMALQRYDVRSCNGKGPFEERWWYPINYPVVRDSVLLYFVHRVEEVTRFVQLQQTTKVFLRAA